jgi:hypothetical protein
MTDRAQFEAMLEALINEDQETAKEIFHNIVVGKSREIYEELLESDFSQDTGNPYAKQTEGSEEEEESMEEEEAGEEADDSEESDDSEEGDDSEENPFGGEEGEDGEDDGEEGDDAFGGEEDGEAEGGDMEDRVMDLEDALEDLKAEFEQLMAGEEAEEHDHPGIHDMGGDDMGGDMGPDDMGAAGEPDELQTMMEYVNKVGTPKMGDNGVNTKSVIDNMKNDMGGTTANIAKNFSTTSGGTQGGLLAPTTKPQDGGNINVPGGKAGKTAFKKQEPGHGAEKAGKKETSDKSAGSVLNGAPKRNK